MQDIKDFDYLFLINNNVLLTYCKIKRVIYKTTFNKVLKYINYTNKIMRKSINNALKQIRLLFEKYL